MEDSLIQGISKQTIEQEIRLIAAREPRASLVTTDGQVLRKIGEEYEARLSLPHPKYPFWCAILTQSKKIEDFLKEVEAGVACVTTLLTPTGKPPGGKGFRKIQRRYRPKLREVRRFLTRAERIEARKTGQLPMRLFKETTAPLKGRLRVKSLVTGYEYRDWPQDVPEVVRGLL
jgi:hypothetical protein